MRKPLGKELYQLLVDSEFKFIKNGGEVNIKDIYKSVKMNYPLYCDDVYKCCDHCKTTSVQPEWKHIVRSALQTMKKNGKVKPTKWGYWLFSFSTPPTKEEITRDSKIKNFLKNFFHPWF